MKKKILSSIWIIGVLTLAVFCLSACDRDLDVQQSYPFTVETMPVQKDIIRGQTAEIRCTLKRWQVCQPHPALSKGRLTEQAEYTK